MRCDVCKREMTALLFSYACDFCDGLRAEPAPFRGFVVYRGGAERRVREEYVFRSREDAERWRSLSQLDQFEIRKVESNSEFRWRKSAGSAKELQLADKLFEIFPDHRYEPGPNRAHVA